MVGKSASKTTKNVAFSVLLVFSCVPGLEVFPGWTLKKFKFHQKKLKKAQKGLFLFYLFHPGRLLQPEICSRKTEGMPGSTYYSLPYYSAQKSRVIFRECYVRCLIFLVRLVIKGGLYKIFGCFPASSIQGWLVLNGMYPWGGGY